MQHENEPQAELERRTLEPLDVKQGTPWLPAPELVRERIRTRLASLDGPLRRMMGPTAGLLTGALTLKLAGLSDKDTLELLLYLDELVAFLYYGEQDAASVA